MFNELEIIEELYKKYNTKKLKIISNKLPFPKAHKGDKEIRAIVLGADPSHVTDDGIKQINTVFGLDNPDKSPYWFQIKRNLKTLKLTEENLYVQNVCKNYFEKETSQHKQSWLKVASEYWIPKLKEELDNSFSPEIPVLITTQFILQAVLKNKSHFICAKEIYKQCNYIVKENNLLGRNLYALYRHPSYSLAKWSNYNDFLLKELNRL